MRSEEAGPDCIALEGYELTPSFSVSAWRLLLTLKHVRHLSFLLEILGRRRLGENERQRGKQTLIVGDMSPREVARENKTVHFDIISK